MSRACAAASGEFWGLKATQLSAVFCSGASDYLFTKEKRTMRLSNAIALGRTIQKGGSGWQFCDCAIGMGLAAVGIAYGHRSARKAIELWPWLGVGPNILNWQLNEVSNRYFEVAKGKLTLDQLIDWVRANEPAEAVPVEAAEEKTIAGLAPSLVAQG